MRECLKCKGNDYTNKGLVMLINECAHPLCKNCVETLYARNAAPCHVCGRTLRKTTFWEQVFDDPVIEKETNIRKRLRKIYNLKEDDFPTLKDFNDYLERFEKIVWNLSNGVDVEETEHEISLFKEMNGEIIERNRKRLDADQMWVLEQLKDEREMKRRLAEEEGRQQLTEVSTNTKAIMNELRDSKLPAELILDRERKRQIEVELAEKEEMERKKKRAKEVAQGKRDTISFAVSARAGERVFTYHSPRLVINGPPLPAIGDLEPSGYLQYMRTPRKDAIAGGYRAELGCMRAIFEARLDLFFGFP